ncbi:MAG: hypothetical protein AAF497_14555 [Planctomycetota bacterium]
MRFSALTATLALCVMIPGHAVEAATYAIISLNLDGSDVRMIATDDKWKLGSASVSGRPRTARAVEAFARHLQSLCRLENGS